MRALLALSPILALIFALGLAPHARAQGAPTWEQRVAYTMEVDIDAPNHQMAGVQTLVYTNNSPHALDRAFWHLYFNAFQPQSMMAERNRNLPDPDGRVVPRIFELGPDEIGYHNVHSLTMNGQPVAYDVFDTVLRADLPRPIAPGETVTFEMAFDSQIPLQTRRSGRDSREGIDFSMAQWYPKMAHYDSRGWHADPYVGREFIAPFGTFDVKITLPAEYVVGSTGTLQNPDEIGHGYSDREVVHAPGERLTWHYVADDVHDFAWGADPDYLHERVVAQDGTTFHLLYQPDVAEGWATMKDFVPALFAYLSRNLGPYAYPQFTVIQGGDGGMEYPMLTLVTGRRPLASLYGVTAHEAIHMWYYGMMAPNESDYAWIDEGFTSYWTSQVMADLFQNPAGPRHDAATEGILRIQESGLFETLSTPSDYFHTNAAYGTASYTGGRNVAHLLEGVIGEEAFDRFWIELYEDYLFRHIEPADIERVAEEVSGMELDWFFWQLLDSERRMDYELDELEQAGTTVTIEIDREDGLFFPVDVRLTLADGSEQWVHVPTSESFGHKPVPAGWTVAEPWPWTYEEWDVTVPVRGEVVKAELDPLGLTPDYNRLNNTSGLLPPRDVSFFRAPSPTRDAYSIGWAPVVDYNEAVDYGFGLGVQALGAYIDGQHELYAMLKLWPERLDSDASPGTVLPRPDCALIDPCPFPVVRTGAREASWFEGIDYAVRYGTTVPNYSNRSRVGVAFEKHIGTLKNQIWGEHTFGGPLVALGKERGTLRFEATHLVSPWARAFMPYLSFTSEIDFPWFQSLRDRHDFVGTALYTLGDPGRSRASVRIDVGGSLRSGNRPFSFVDDLGNVVGSFDESLRRTGASRAVATLDYVTARGPVRARAGILAGYGVSNLAGHRAFRLGAPSTVETWDHAAARTALGAAAESYAYDDASAPLLVAVSPYGPTGYAAVSERVSRPSGFTELVQPQTLFGTRTVQARLEVGAAPLDALPLEIGAFAGAAFLPDLAPGPSGGRDESFRRESFYADLGLSADLRLADIPALRRLTEQYEVLGGLHLSARLPFYLFDPGRELAGQGAIREGAVDEIDFSRFQIGIVVRP
jgi:hypothetical protein